jgi:alkylhydroperoxidase family enzyme
LQAVTDPIEELRASATALRRDEPAMAAYLEQVRTRAYSLTDADLDALKAAGLSEDEIFEQTVVVAIEEGLRRLDAGLRVAG